MRRRKAATPKRRNAPKVVRRHNSSAADQETKVTRLTRELHEALEQQTATAEVLQVINASAGDLVPVFDAMLEKAMSLCGASFGGLWIRDGDFARAAAARNMPRPFVEFLTREPVPMTQVFGHSFHDRRFLQIADLPATEAYRNHLPVTVAGVELGGIRTFLGVPLRKDGSLVGIFAIYRQEVRPFSDKQIALLENFAAQAVIAIENTRLLNELRQLTADLTESLEQQTAMSEVLEVISRSAFDLQAVFETVVGRSARLSGVAQARANIFRFDGELLRMAAAHNATPEWREWVAQHPIRPGQHSASARAALERRTIHIPDILADPEYTYGLGMRGVEPFRTILAVPILKGDELLGVILIYLLEVKPFTDKQIALVETFADQVAIAIENVRLFEAEQQRSRELAESLEQQTATAEVLSVISRSKFELQPVLQSVVETAMRLCRAEQAVIYRLEEGAYRFAAGHSSVPEYLEIERQTTIVPGSGSVVGRAALTRQVARIDDAWTDPLYEKKNDAKVGGVRSMIGVPLMREGESIGVIAPAWNRVEPFVDREIELVATFADQAVIAIENVRLFTVLRQRTDDLR